MNFKLTEFGDPQHGIQRVYFADEIAEALRFLESVDRFNAPRMDLTGLGVRGRFARLARIQVDVITYLTDDGVFVYNREVMTSPHSRR